MSLLRLLQRAFLVLLSFWIVTIVAHPAGSLTGRQDDVYEGSRSTEANEAGHVSPEAAEVATAPGGRLYFLSQSRRKMISMGPNGENPQDIVTGMGNTPDGIAVDKSAGHIYYSNMRPGSIQRVNLDGSNPKTIVPTGVFKVGKQLVLVEENGQKKLYWCDREGMKVMRSNIDGSGVETIVDTSRIECGGGSQCKYAVGVAVDTKHGWVYWTQKGTGGTGSIHRAPTRFQAGATAATRTDVQAILQKLPEPIDLRWVDGYGLYWTDRGKTAGGNSVSRMQMANETMAGKAQFAAKGELLASGLSDGIGIAIDVPSGKMWFTDLGGRVYQSNLDGSAKKTIASGQGSLVGIDYA